jgi:hypothetical protein
VLKRNLNRVFSKPTESLFQKYTDLILLQIMASANSSASAGISAGSVPAIRKAAVVIGIDYVGQSGSLQGCRADARAWHEALVRHFGVSPENITFMVDGPAAEHASYGTPPNKPVRAPTGKNIMQALVEVCALANRHPELEEIWITYSGHGSYLHTSETSPSDGLNHANEDDGRHETICPVDWQTSGMIVDDALHDILSLAPPTVRIISPIDACHSETALDLRYRYVSGIKNVVENPACKIKADCYMISGCRDTQTSADAPVGPAGAYSGAMTWAMLKTLKDYNYTITCYALLKNMRELLKDREFSQVPQITCTRPLNSSKMFACYHPDACSRPSSSSSSSS